MVGKHPITMRIRIFFFQAEDGIRYLTVTGVQTCALPISALPSAQPAVRLPLELDRIRTAVGLDGATLVGAEGFSDRRADVLVVVADQEPAQSRSEEHTSELQSQSNLVCRLLLEKKNINHIHHVLHAAPILNDREDLKRDYMTSLNGYISYVDHYSR